MAAVVVVAAVTLAFADASIVALAIPDLYVEFGSTISAVSWVLTGYALAVALAGLGCLGLLRHVSGRTLAAGGALLFSAASLVAGLAPSLSALIAARVVQGVGGAALVAGSLGVLVSLLSDAGIGDSGAGDSGRAKRWWAVAGVTGAAIGPVLGGAVTQVFEWRAVFVVQAPIALFAAIACLATRRDAPTATIEVEPPRRPRGALVADGALALTFGALVGVLFLGVLLLVVVWGLPPIAGAFVVSALPIGTLAAPRLAGAMSDRGAVITGAVTLAAGLITLAHLPSIEPWWVAGGLALCGLGFGALVHALNGHALPHGSGVRAATLTSTARHLGLVLGLAIIAPVLATQVTAAAEVAPVPATKAMLDAPIDGPTKIRIALDMRDLIEDASEGEVPDLDAVFQRNGAADDPAVATLGHDIERGIQEVLTRSFRDSFTLAAGFALLAGMVGVVAVSMASNANSPGARSHRRRYGAAVAGLTVVAAALLPVGAVRASDDDFGATGVVDPCTAPPDPFPGDGFDAAAQRFLFSGLNGAACELGISREELILSLEPRAGVDIEWDRDTIIQAVKDGFDRAVHDAADRGTIPGWLASALSWTVDHSPVSWFLERLGVA